jgi:hypothetical protein
MALTGRETCQCHPSTQAGTKQYPRVWVLRLVYACMACTDLSLHHDSRSYYSLVLIIVLLFFPLLAACCLPDACVRAPRRLGFRRLYALLLDVPLLNLPVPSPHSVTPFWTLGLSTYL